MKRYSVLLAAVAGLALQASAAMADSTVKMVEVITSPPRTEFLKTQIAEFEAANPGVKVELISLPWGQAFEKFLTMVQAGDTPDIVEMPERWMGLYANNGQLGGPRALYGQVEGRGDTWASEPSSSVPPSTTPST